MSRAAKLALGAITLVPVVWMFAWFGYLIYGFVSHGPWPAFDAMLAGMAAVVVLTLALAVFYGRHAWRNQRLSQDERTTWTIFVTLMNAFAQPVYWYLHIWRASDLIRTGGA